MSHQGSNIGWQPASGGGGGSGDYPFALAYAKTRRFRITSQTIIPAGAIIVEILNTGYQDATILVSGGATEQLGPNLKYNFEAQQNTVDKKLEVSKQITATPQSGERLEIFVAYAASSAVDPNSI